MYQLDLTHVSMGEEKALGPGFAGQSMDGHSISFTNQAMWKDGKPFFGISGEVHYCRVAPDQWKDTLIKAKCGGVNLIATYVFWNVHEEKEGTFRFDGCRDIRRFVELCKSCGLMVILRIGPFAHGEMRNGGLPDWLYGKPFEVRSNQEGYLAHVRRFYAAIHGQVNGLYFEQDGPIVGIQLENEYMHSSAPWELTTGVSNEWVNGGQDGEAHICALKQIAREEGLIVPFYTCTAWGGGMAPTAEVLPLWGGYAYWPWIFYGKAGEHPCTPEYIYRDNHNNAVPQTYNFAPNYAPESMPYACCEMMGGMMCSYHYRFSLPMQSVDALANIKLGSGCAMLGYYMYRGGTTPTGELTPYLNESQVCKRSYDYQAPIGEFGQRRETYYRLRTLHEFCSSFGGRLLGAVTVLPESSADMQPEDRENLRFCARVKGNSGFLFINNFQDHLELPARSGEQVVVRLPEESIDFTIDLASGENCILPFNFPMGEVLLKKATVQPITHLNIAGQSCWFFMIPQGMKPVMQFEDQTLVLRADEISDFTIAQERVIVLPRCDAMHFSHLEKDGQTIAVLADSGVLWDGQCAALETNGQTQTVLTMPPMDGGEIRRGPFGGSVFTPPPAPTVALEAEQVGPARWIVSIPAEAVKGHKTVLLHVQYMGDIGQAFLDGELISDNFCNGQPWAIRLDEYADKLEKHPLTLAIVPVKEGTSISVDASMAARMEHVDGISACVSGLTLEYIDEMKLRL